VKSIFIGFIGFLALDLYFNLFALQFSNSYIQLSLILLFFPFAHYVAKWVGLSGLAGMGVHFHKGWWKNFIISFFIGFSFWTLWNGYYFFIGSYQFQGLNHRFWGMPFLEVFVGYLLGSLINDIIVRGYIINYFKKKWKMGWVLATSILLYTLDDFWYAGFSLNNIFFSIILGFSLTYAFYKTGSIWANTGLHFGLNIAYGLLFGQNGKSNSSFILIQKMGDTSYSYLSALIDYCIPILMFLLLHWAIRFYTIHRSKIDHQIIKIHM
jgi:membrane protease YdiL (CAAX protease family)